MRTLLLLALAGLTALSSLSAAAGDLPADPRLAWSVPFGGMGRLGAPSLQLALDMSSRDGRVTVAQADLSPGMSAFSLAGLPLWQSHARLSQNGDGSGAGPTPAESPSHAWIYWTLGGLAATAAIIVGADKSAGDLSASGCTGVCNNGSSGGSGGGSGGGVTGVGGGGAGCVNGTCAICKDGAIDSRCPQFAGVLDEEAMRWALRENERWVDAGTGYMGDLQSGSGRP